MKKNKFLKFFLKFFILYILFSIYIFYEIMTKYNFNYYLIALFNLINFHSLNQPVIIKDLNFPKANY
jgi:hypothetical protein